MKGRSKGTGLGHDNYLPQIFSKAMAAVHYRTTLMIEHDGSGWVASFYVAGRLLGRQEGQAANTAIGKLQRQLFNDRILIDQKGATR